MPSAEIIAIGTELLLGEIQDTNTRYLALKLRDTGIDLFRSTMVGDNAQRIAQAISEALIRSDIVITTGGLGPTVDDPTRLAVAIAMGVDIEFKPELWDQIQNRFQRFNRIATENNKRQAYIPKGAIAVENPVGTAPAFFVETGPKVIVSLPGVPREMEYLIENRVLPYLKDHYCLSGTIKASVFHAAGVGESQVDEWVGDLETLTNPTVGLLAHPGQIDIRITAKADSFLEADRMIEEVAQTIQERLGDHIFGRDKETLASVTQSRLVNAGWSLALVECGFEGELHRYASQIQSLLEPTGLLTAPLNLETLQAAVQAQLQQTGASAGLGAIYQTGPERQLVTVVVLTPLGNFETSRAYGGPPQNGISFAVNTSIDFLRRHLPVT